MNVHVHVCLINSFIYLLLFQLIGPLGPKESFIFDDLEALYNFEISSHARTVSNAIDSVDLILPDPDSDTTEYRSDLVMRLASLLRSQTKARRLELDGFKKEHRYTVHVHVLRNGYQIVGNFHGTLFLCLWCFSQNLNQ